MDDDEITRRLLAHFSTPRGWNPIGECYCASCSESCGCEVPGIFEALGLPVPEPTFQMPVSTGPIKVDMSQIALLEAAPNSLFNLVSKLVDTDQFKHDTLPYSVRPIRP